MKPTMFIASSVERLDIAYAVQQELEHHVEATVWTQGVFAPSRTSIQSLVDRVVSSDSGVFILAPDDMLTIRDATKQVARDNVIFELGLFIGGLGSDRCFLITPRGVSDLHLPTDLLGLTPATYDPQRQDGNLQAALGPLCNTLRNAISRLGPLASRHADTSPPNVDDSVHATRKLINDPDDCIVTIQSWMSAMSYDDQFRGIRYDDVDADLGLEAGSARVYIEQAARKFYLVADRKGKDLIQFKRGPMPSRIHSDMP